MNLLGNMTIKMRLALFIGILVVTNIVLLVMTSGRLNATNDNFHEYEKVGVPGKMYSLMITGDMNYVSRLTRSIMLGDDYQKNMDRLSKRLEQIYANFSQLREVATQVRDKVRAKQIAAAVDSSIQDTRAFLEDGRSLMQGLSNRERTPELLQQTWNSYRTQATPLANKARGSFGELIALIDGQMEQSRTAVDASLDDVVKITAITNIAIVAILLIVGLLISRSITRPLSRLQSTIIAIDSGADLTMRINLTGNDEISQVAQATDRMLERIHASLDKVAQAANSLAEASGGMEIITAKTQQAVSSQRAETEQVATAINEMSATVQEVAKSANRAAEAAHNADKEARDGRQVVSETMEAINGLASEVERAAEVISKVETESEKIGSVLEVIRGISEQTNLLALNAAIEAARAGEQGRGFAVVADEVRTLASRTQASTQEIQAMIESLQGGAREAVSVMASGKVKAHIGVEQAARAGDSLSSITTAVSTITEMNTQIASAAEEQTSVAEEINQSIVNISQIAEQSLEGTQQINATSDQLAQLAEQLRSEANCFRL